MKRPHTLQFDAVLTKQYNERNVTVQPTIKSEMLAFP